MSADRELLLLARLLDEDQPPPAELYVAPRRAVVGKVVGEIRADLTGKKKHLLFGARGAGKSTQLLEIIRGLQAHATLVSIDLDRTGITVAGLSAFDLLYVIGVAALTRVPETDRTRAFKALKQAYAGSAASELGELTEALGGIATLGTAVGTFAGAIGLATGPVGAVTAGVGMIAKGLRLRKEPSGLVSASSPQGREIQQAVHGILNSIRDHGQAPVVIVIDGLEKVNGDAPQWFRDTFENTRLVLDLEATMVVACPPCPFTHTNSAHQFGYIPQVVWGFPPEEFSTLETILRRRIDAVPVRDASGVLDGACASFAAQSGGHPRHAIGLLHRAVTAALRAARAAVTQDDCAAATQELREYLALGLIGPSYGILARVDQRHVLPDNEMAAQLFADGRILAYPPDDTGAPTFSVHPLLDKALAKHRE